MIFEKGHKAESDTGAETHETRSRAAKTETEPEGTYVGRTESDDAIDAGETGAEARNKTNKTE